MSFLLGIAVVGALVGGALWLTGVKRSTARSLQRFQAEVLAAPDAALRTFAPAPGETAPRLGAELRLPDGTVVFACPEVHHEHRRQWRVSLGGVATPRAIAFIRRGTANAEATDGVLESDVTGDTIEHLQIHGHDEPVRALLNLHGPRDAVLQYFASGRARCFVIRNATVWSETELDTLSLGELREVVAEFMRTVSAVLPALPGLPDSGRPLIDAGATGSISGDPMPIPLFRR